jgi:CubicO group peptidase (beta-lactamase class C family)
MQDGIIDLYDSVERYIPEFRDQMYETSSGERKKVERPMVVRELLNMTSGLTYGGTASMAERDTDLVINELIGKLGTDRAMTTMEFAARIGKGTLRFHPGQGWQYGVSADILGAVIEKASGMRFGEYLKKIIFDPLHMEDTGFFVPKEKKQRMAEVYRCESGKEPELFTYDNLGIRNNGDENPFESGGAGLFSTIDDYSRFCNMLLRGGMTTDGEQILRESAVHFLTEGAQDGVRKPFDEWLGLEGFSYANLMRVLKEPSLNGTIGHIGEYGWDGWLGTYMNNDPSTGTNLMLMLQRVDYGTGNFTRRIKNIVFS